MKIRVLAWLLIVSLLLPSISSADSADTSQLLDNESIETQTLQDFLLQANRDYDDNDEVEIIVTLDENHFGGLGEEVPANLLYNDFYLNKQQNYGNQILEEAFSRFEKNGILIEPMVTYNTLFVGFATQTTFATAKKIANTDFVKMVEMSVERNKPTLSPQEVAGGFRSASFYKPLSEMIEPINSRDLVGSEEVFKNNKGEGMVIAIIDSGYDLEHQSFYLTDLGKSKAKLNQTTVEGIVNSGSVSKGKYHNEKIPFIYSYINKNTKMKEAKFASHGQHVAGIAAGNSVKYKSGNKEGNFIGIAPESQLLLMRVFSDESPTTSSVHYTKALEDALHLKADSVNMSLGSPAGDHRSTEKTTVNAINRLSQAGCVVAIAAGNDTAFGNAAQRKPDVNNPDYGILATPALIDRSLAVASLQHDTVTLKYADVLDDKKQVVKSYALDWQETTKEYAPNKEYSFVYVNLGKKSDFNESLEGKYALIERGEIPFGEKVQNAMEHNAAGVIIFNSQQGGENFFKMSGVKDFPIPVAAMKRDSGLFLKENPNTHLKFSKHEGTFDSDSKGKLSEFSSFGLTADATFKPEITAPGGNIYSLANNNGFSNQSGTSMASPQVAGGIALVKNRVNRDFSYLSDEQRWQMVKNLLMSTAKIHYNTETGAASSPRNQGAGIMNLSAALSSNIVLRSGEFGETKIIHTAAQPQQEINFSVLNYSDKAESFKYKAVVVRDEVENGHFTLRPSAIKTIEGSDIQVEAKSSNNAPGQTNITMTIDTSEVADQLKAMMPNGYFIDGFVIVYNDSMELSIPFVTFVGGKTGLDELSYVEDSIYNLLANKRLPFYFKPEIPSYYMPGRGNNHDFTHLFTKVGRRNQILGAKDNFTFANPQFTEKYVVSPNSDGIADDIGLRFVMLRNGNIGLDIYEWDGKNRVEASKVSLGEDSYQKNYGKREGDNSYAIANLWPKEDTPIKEGDYVMVIRNWGTKEKSQAAKDIEIPFSVDITRPKISNVNFDENARKLTFDASDERSGIRKIEVSYVKNNKKVIIPNNNGYEIPSDIELKDVQILVTDDGYNSLLLSGASLLDLENLGSVKPMLVWEDEKDSGLILEYEIYSVKDGEKSKQPVKESLLPVGDYVLVVKNLSEKYYLKNGAEYPFKITESQKNVSVPIDIKLIPSHTVSLMPMKNRDLISKISARSLTTSKEFVFFTDGSANTGLYEKVLPYDEYEFTVEKRIKDSKIKVYHLRSTDKPGQEERAFVGEFEDRFVISVTKDSKLNRKGVLAYSIDLESFEKGKIEVLQTGEDIEVEYHAVLSDGEEVLFSPLAYQGKNPKGANFDLDSAYMIVPVNLPKGYYSVPSREFALLKTNSPTQQVSFEIKKSEGYGSIEVESNASDFKDFNPTFIAYDPNGFYGLRNGIKTTDLSNLPYGNWMIQVEKTQESADIVSIPEYLEVRIDESNPTQKISFQFEQTEPQSSGVLTAHVRDSKDEYVLNLTDLKTNQVVSVSPGKLGIVLPGLPFGGYKVEIENLENDRYLASPEFITMYQYENTIYHYVNLIVVPHSYYQESDPVKTELFEIWENQADVKVSPQYQNASDDKKSEYDEAINEARKVIDSLVANESDVQNAIRRVSEALQHLDGNAVVPPPSGDSGGSSGGGSSNSSVRPEPIGSSSQETKPKEETIQDNNTSLSESPAKLLATLKINAKGYRVFDKESSNLKNMDVAPILHQGRTMLPARMIAELLSIRVNFNESTKTATFIFEKEDNAQKVENVVELTLGQKMMKVNGKEQPLSADILNVNGRIMLPLTDIQKALKELGLAVDIQWEHHKKEISLFAI